MAWKLINKYNDYLSVSDLLIIKNHCKDKTWDSKQAIKLLGRKRFTDFFNNKLLNDDFYIYFDRYLEKYENKDIVNHFLA